jgi:lysozyme
MMNIPAVAIALAKHFEGFFSRPYLCPAGFWTIAWGHLCRKDHPHVTKAEGEAYLTADMQQALASAIRQCPVLLTVPEEKLGAIVDFVFNLGGGRLQASTLRRRINERNWPEAARELRRWVYGGGRKLPGLVLRREAEARLM